MSKRYGRNQKRKAREQIANLSEKVEELEMLGARNRDIVERTAQVLGRNFITLPPESREMRDLDQLNYGWREPIYKDVPPHVIDDMNPSFIDCALSVVEFSIMSGSTTFDDLKQDIHFRINYEGNPVGYAISERTLQRMPADLATQNIAKEMAEHFMNNLGYQPGARGAA